MLTLTVLPPRARWATELVLEASVQRAGGRRNCRRLPHTLRKSSDGGAAAGNPEPRFTGAASNSSSASDRLVGKKRRIQANLLQCPGGPPLELANALSSLGVRVSLRKGMPGMRVYSRPGYTQDK